MSSSNPQFYKRQFDRRVGGFLRGMLVWYLRDTASRHRAQILAVGTADTIVVATAVGVRLRSGGWGADQAPS